MKQTLYFALLAVVAAVPCSGQPVIEGLGADIVIVTAEVPHLFDTNEPGPYNVIMDRIISAHAGSVDFRKFPPKRALRYFFDRASDCFFIGTDNRHFYVAQGIEQEKLLISKPFHSPKIRVFSATDAPKVTSRASLTGRRIALDSAVGDTGFFERTFLPPGSQTIVARSIRHGLALMAIGRAEMLVAYDLDMSLYLGQTNRPAPVHFDKQFSLLTNRDSLVCHMSPATTDFIETANRVLGVMAQSGELDTLLSPIQLANGMQSDANKKGLPPEE